MASKVAFGFIPVPVKETTKFLTGTSLTELLAEHVEDFIRLSCFQEGLNYGFLVNVPIEEYAVRSAVDLDILDTRKRYTDVEETKLFVTFPVLLAQKGSELSFHSIKPLKHLTWNDIDDLLKHMNFMSCRKLSKWKSNFDAPIDWVFEERRMERTPLQQED